MLARVEYCRGVGQDAVVDRFYEQFGQRVRRARLAQGMNQSALGHRVGLERSSISNVEKGRQRVQLHMLVEFAAALGVPPDDLLPETADPLARVPPETRPFVHEILTRARAQRHG